MDNSTITIIMFAMMFGLLFLGLPVAYSLGIPGIVGLYLLQVPLDAVVPALASPIRDLVLLAIPFFILATSLMGESGITRGLLNFVQSLVGARRGSLAHVNVLSSMLFGGISGSANADAAAMSKIFIPEMSERGYPREFSVAVTATSATIGSIIPPSIIMIVWGAFSGASIGALFIGGVIPGVLVGLSFMTWIFIRARRGDGLPRGDKSSLRIVIRSLRGALVSLPIPVIIIGGIMGGWFTPTEAGAVAVGYVVLASLLTGKLRWRATKDSLTDSVVVVGAIFFTICNAMLFGWVLSYLGFAAQAADVLTRLDVTGPVLLVVTAVIFVALGTFMSTIEAIVIFAPTIAAAGTALGVDPIHLGIVATVSLSIGLVTPPYGLCLLIASQVGEVPIARCLVRVLPFVAAELVVLALLIAFPRLVTALPNSLDLAG